MELLVLFDTRPLYVMGDLHGQMHKLVGHLRSARLINDSYEWIGEEKRLWFLGDYFDRGPDGLDVISLIMHLQTESGNSGGEVGALLGNHDVLILAAKRFADDPYLGSEFLGDWIENGGVADDLRGLTPEHEKWLSQLQSLALADDILLAHADSDFYLSYGNDINSINNAIHGVLSSAAPNLWRQLLNSFASRHAFDESKPGGAKRALRFLGLFRATRLVHGHTPIDKVTHVPPSEVTGPYVYANGVCTNVDGGMYRGGPGFIYRMR